MPKLTYLLFLTASLVCQAQPLCEPTPQVRDALKEANKQHSGPLDRTAAMRALLQQFPDDLWVHRAYQDTFRQGQVYRQQVIDEYAGLLSKHAKDPEFLYLYGRTLVGTKTPEAITSFDQAVAKDPKYAPAHLSLVEIYRAPNFKDPDKALANLQTWMEACPTQFEGFHYLERMDNSDFTKGAIARMRALIESRTDSTALGHYRSLWTLEFQMHPAPEYPHVKENIRKDLARLREMDSTDKPFLATTLREGYKLVDDKEGLAWVDEKFPANSPKGANGAMEAYQEWQTSHPYPQPKPGEKFNQDAFQARNKALLDVTAEWIQKWPDNNFVWSQRLMALQSNRETPDAEVDRVAEGLRKTASSAGPNSSTWVFQLASLYLQRNMHTTEIPDMIMKGLQDMDKAPVFPSSDLYPQSSGMNMQTMRMMTRTQGLNTLIDAYQKLDHPDKALEALGDLRKALDEAKPKDSAKEFEKQNWDRQDATYWDKMGQVAEKQGRKLDALTFYQNQILRASFNQDYLKRRAKVLWTDLGGTDAAWDAWLARIDPAKAVVVANVHTEWEKMNKPLPEFDLADMGGKTWRLADIKGKTTLINLWATWCGPCKMELPQLQKLYEKLKDRPDIRIITLNTDDNPGLIESFLKENKYTFPVIPARAYVDKLVPSLSIPRNWIADKQAVLKLESIGFGGGSADKWVDNMTETIEKTK